MSVTTTRRDFLRTCGAMAASLTCGCASRGAEPRRRPNFVFFLVDDMGWMDSTVYGSRYYETPNLERLAARSLKFTDAYAACPLCSPTRGSIMTGRYPCRFGLTSAAGHLPPQAPDAPRYAAQAAPSVQRLLPQSARYMPEEEHTIAEALRDAGYATGHFGKWHLGLEPRHWPEAQGFQVSFHGAPDPGPPSYFSPYGFKAGTVADGPPGEYIADRLTTESIKFLREHRDGPFYLNLWHYSVHGPWGHKPEVTERYVGRSDPRGHQGNPIMAAMLRSMDESLGRIMDALDELDLTGDTVLIFFSDNGGNVHSNTPEDVRPAALREGSPAYARIQDWRKWAGDLPPTDNSPLRGGKATIFEGGTREPLLICWPGVTRPGTTTGEVVSSVDFHPTMLEAAGLSPQAGLTLDGESLVPVLKGDGHLRREAIFCHFPHSFGRRSPAASYVRKGDWKLIRVWDTSAHFPDERLLFNLRDDLGETTNLAARETAKVQELEALLSGFIAATGALLPIPNPAYNPAAQPIQGWQPLGRTTLAQGDGALALVSPEGRTQMQTHSVPKLTGRLRVQIRLKSERGGGIVYWATEAEPGFVRERRVEFAAAPNDQWREIEVGLTAAAPLSGLRLDLSMLPCTVEVAWIRLCREDGQPAQEWHFDRRDGSEYLRRDDRTGR